MPTRRTRAAAVARRGSIRVLTAASRVRVVGPAADLGLRVLFDGLAPRWDRIRADAVYGDALDQALDQLRAAAPRSVLDVACGTGMAAARCARRFPAASIACCDISPRMVSLAREALPSVDARVASSHRLPWERDAFALTVTLDGVFAVDELVRVTEPGGTCLVVYSRGGGVPVARSLRSLRREFEAAGCAVHTTDDGPWILRAVAG